MGTPKRERQKANRQQRLEELARQARNDKRKRTGMYIILIPIVAVAISGIVWLINRGDNGSAATDVTTTTLFATTTVDPNAPTTYHAPLQAGIELEDVVVVRQFLHKKLA